MILKTPLERFDNLPDYDFDANYCAVDGLEQETLNMHYVDYGDSRKATVLMLHGEPSWSFLYRKMIKQVGDSGARVIAPDLIGFGKSDKLENVNDYSYSLHLSWLKKFVDYLALTNVVLFCQDWGGLLGLRLVADYPEMFSAVIASNTMLPTGDQAAPEAFKQWQQFALSDREFNIGNIIQRGTFNPLPVDVVDAYNAPFPSEKFKAGTRAFPSLVPTTRENVESENNRQAWQKLAQFKQPFITAFSDMDPITKGGDKFFQKIIPGCAGQTHHTIQNGGHFLQEDADQQLSQIIIDTYTQIS